jgi:hypothetical protein
VVSRRKGAPRPAIRAFLPLFAAQPADSEPFSGGWLFDPSNYF